MKKCYICKVEKDLDKFSKDKNRKDGLQNTCKSCCKQYCEDNKDKIKQYREDYRGSRVEYDKQYREGNKDKIAGRRKQYYEGNKDKILERNKQYRENNKDKISETQKQYRENNKDKIAEQQLQYTKNRLKTDQLYKLACNLRSRLSPALKNNYKTGSAVRDLGCSIEELKVRFELLFYPNPDTGEVMSWENHGLYGWHIDHIKPLASFNLDNRDELLKAVHYSNLQPLWAEENLSKSDRIVEDILDA